MKIFLVTILMIITFISCEKATYKPMEIPDEGVTLHPLVQKEIDRKNEIYRKNAIKRCRDNALKKAIKYVDSIIVEELNFDHVDDVNFPSRPSRPQLPEGIILDTTAVEPI